jgi:hypothetical protein
MNKVADNTPKYASLLTFEDVFMANMYKLKIFRNSVEITGTVVTHIKIWNSTRILQEIMHPPSITATWQTCGTE